MKKIIAALLIGLMVISLVGCESQSSNEIKIGVLQDLSGSTSVLGNAVKKGADLAVQKINSQGGINGKKIKLVSYDVKGDPQEAINAYNRIVDQDKVSAIVGPPISNIGLALVSVANSKKVPIVGSYVDPRITTKSNNVPQDYMYMMQPSSTQYAQILAGYSINKLNVKKVAIFYDQSNAYAVSLISPFKSYIENHGGKVVTELVYKKNDKDYKTQLNQIKRTDAQAIYFPNYTQDCVLLAQQIKEVGLTLPVIGGLDFAPPMATLLSDPTMADNIYFANNFSDIEPQLKEAHDAYVKKYNEEPINKTYLGYDSMLIIADAIKRSGKTDGASIKKALDATKDLQCTTGKITLSDKTHMPVGLSMVIYKIQAGKYVDLGRYIPDEQKAK